MKERRGKRHFPPVIRFNIMSKKHYPRSGKNHRRPIGHPLDKFDLEQFAPVWVLNWNMAPLIKRPTLPTMTR